MSNSGLSKKKGFKALIVFVIIVLAILITLLVLFLEKRKFYNEEIRPFVEIINAAECTSEPCHLCEASTSKYEYYTHIHSDDDDTDKVYSVDIAKGFKCSAQIYVCTSKPYSEKTDDRQYEVNVHVFVDGKDDYIWQVSVDENISSVSKVGVFAAEIDPNTLEITGRSYSEDSSIDYMKECEPEITETINDLRTFFSPYLD